MPEQANAIGRANDRSTTRRGIAPARILVVDDEPDACELVRQVLEGEGYSATSVTSAHGALEKIGTQDFDLVLTDVAMAEMNGLDLCRKIADTRPDTPFIVVTGKGDMSTVIAALRIGARDFLTKPLDADSLVLAVARSLRYQTVGNTGSSQPEQDAGKTSEVTLTGMLGTCAAIQ